MNIDIRRKINIIGIGSISTLLILLMVEVAFAQILTDTLIGNINNNLMLLIIVMGLFLFTIVISVIVGYLITKDVRVGSAYRASVMSLMCLVLFLFVITNVSLYASYRDIYVNIHGFEILPIFPQVLITFGIYILNEVFYLFILMIVVYYVFFVLFLDKLYRGKIS